MRGESDLIESGEFEDLENVLEFGSISLADGGGGVEFLSSDLEDSVCPVGHDGFETGRGDGFWALEFGKTSGDSGDGGGVSKVILHELFDGDLGGGSLVAPFLGDAHLFGASQDLLCPSGSEVEVEPDAIEELVSFQQGLDVGLTEGLAVGEGLEIAHAELRVADPADEMEIAESSG